MGMIYLQGIGLLGIHNTSYDLTKNDNITLTLNNLLDRDNYSNRYGNLDLPYNWRITYTRTF